MNHRDLPTTLSLFDRSLQILELIPRRQKKKKYIYETENFSFPGLEGLPSGF